MRRQMISLLSVAGALTLVSSGAFAADDIVNTNGFEPPDYVTGVLNTQQGWFAEGFGGGTEPVVVDAPDPVLDTQALRLEIDDTQGAYSYCEIQFPDILAEGYTYVTVKFDVYRETNTWLSNLWWYWFDPGEPTYGLQWDEAVGFPGGTYPFGWVTNSVGVETIHDRYVTVEMIWDFDAGVATCYYDDVFVCEVDIVDVFSLTGWAFQLSHDEGAGSGGEVAWIDNFSITASTGEYALTVDPDPMLGGAQATFTATNGTPNVNTFLAYSVRGLGSTYIELLNVTLDLRNPKQAGTVKKSDANGTTVWTLPVPRKAAGTDVWIQVVQFENKTGVVETSVI